MRCQASRRMQVDEAESAVATVVVLSMTRELRPVLAGIMVMGRVGASMAAELWTMRVTEQIDALQTLSTGPYKNLFWPRMMASTLLLPVLVAIGGVLGGFLVGVYKLDFSGQSYLNQTWEHLQAEDVISGLVKAAVFGFIIALMGCCKAIGPAAVPKASVQRRPMLSSIPRSSS